MKKVLLLCCSDLLGIPAVLRLRELNILAAIAMTEKVAIQFIPILKDLGIDKDQIHTLSKKNLETGLRELIDTYKPDTMLTITFSWMIPDAILNLLPNRCINFHFGLLPKYKGGEPIFWEIKNGEKQGGLSVHVMTNELDNGPLLLREELPIFPGETYGLYTHRLGGLAAEAVTKLHNDLDTIEPQPVAADPGPALFFNAPTEADRTINWQLQTAAEIEQLVNATNPRYGGALSSIRQSKIYLFEVAPADINNPNNEQFPPGTIVHADLLYGLIVACIDKQFIKINVALLQQGYFSGGKLFSLGFKVGEAFVTIVH